MMLTSLLQTTVQLDLAKAASVQELSGSKTTFPELVGSLLSAAMAIGALMVLLFFVWAAIEWITAGGEASKIEKARAKITQSIIGLLVLSATLALFLLLQQFLGLEILGTRSSGRSSDRSSGSSFGNDVNSNPNSGLLDSILDGLNDGSNGNTTDTTNNVDSTSTGVDDNLSLCDGFTVNWALVGEAIDRALAENPGVKDGEAIRALRDAAQGAEINRQLQACIISQKN